ncbi:FAR1-related sequence 5 [Striga asiatica]|uniref:Protein FAR1-RELATED SEQUENCE n=1 Tax=Striga asiatica TaxID=4170 RepID=A0A5A7Q3C3_STRAF|nr:FAR1-related sequence 5 [Striga asiatica]
MEAKANAVTINSSPVLSTHLKDVEKHAADSLTRNMFFIVREEIKKEAVLLSKIEHEFGSTKMYSVYEYSKPDLTLTVKFDKDSRLSECSCLQFETVGWPCAHMFAVMKAEHIKEIPSTCVMKRWARNAKENELNKKEPEIRKDVTQNARYGSLISLCNKMCYYASLCDEGYGELCDTITRVTNRMHEIYANSRPCDSETDASKKNEKHHFGVRDPIITKTKGSSGLHSKQKPRRCRKCRLPGHNKSTCPKMKSREDDKDSLDFDASGEDDSQDQSSLHASSRRGYHSCEYSNSSHVNPQPNAFPTSNQWSGNDLSFQDLLFSFDPSSVEAQFGTSSQKHQNGEKGNYSSMIMLVML